jgi:hypothetical protein
VSDVKRDSQRIGIQQKILMPRLVTFLSRYNSKNIERIDTDTVAQITAKYKRRSSLRREWWRSRGRKQKQGREVAAPAEPPDAQDAATEISFKRSPTLGSRRDVSGLRTPAMRWVVLFSTCLVMTKCLPFIRSPAAYTRS